MIKIEKKQRTPLNIKPYEYKRVNFLDAFRKMNFEFLEDEPSLLVEKILSVDPEWIGNANYEAYGDTLPTSTPIQQSTATKVPCLEGEWIVVSYSKDTKQVKNDGVWYGSEWHKYYLCQIDFSQEYLFRIVETFDHIYDAFQYLCDNRLVTVMKSDRKYRKQISPYLANIAISVLSDFEDEEKELTYDELLRVFGKHSEKSEVLSEFVKNSRYIPKTIPEGKDEKEYLAFMEGIKCGSLQRFLSRKPYDLVGFETKLTIKQYLKMVREFKDNYLWNI